MAIVNRDGDVSEQKEWITWVAAQSGASYLGLGTGVTIMLGGPMPYPYVVQSAGAVATGTSGAPQLVFAINRVIGNTGVTTIVIGISNYIIPSSASFMPYVGFSGLVQGSTLLIGQRGDLLVASTAVANTACTNLLINVVVKKTQDIVSHNGISS